MDVSVNYNSVVDGVDGGLRTLHFRVQPDPEHSQRDEPVCGKQCRVVTPQSRDFGEGKTDSGCRRGEREVFEVLFWEGLVVSELE